MTLAEHRRRPLRQRSDMAELVPKLLSLTAQLKRACKAPSRAAQHNQQLTRLLGRLEVLLGDLEEGPPGNICIQSHRTD